MKRSNTDRGLAVLPMVIIIVLVGLAGFSIYSWMSTRKASAEHLRAAESRERELKTQYEAVKKEAEESAAKAEELADNLKKTEEAMRLAEEKASKDSEEKAAMIAELEAKLEEEAAAKALADEKAAELERMLDELEEGIRRAENREVALRSRLSTGETIYALPAAAGFDSMKMSIQGQQSGISAMRSLLGDGQPVSQSQLAALVNAFETSIKGGEEGLSSVVTELVRSGRFSPSSKVGQAVTDLEQSSAKQRTLLDALKRLATSDHDEVIDAGQLQALLKDLETTTAELEARQNALVAVLSQEVQPASIATAAASSREDNMLVELQQSIARQRAEVDRIRRELASANAERDVAIARQKELEKLSIEIRYDIDYDMRSVNYKRRLHLMYDRVANPMEER